jgi:hypothetical protein
MPGKYTIFAALYDEATEGWIWVPTGQGFSSGDYIKINCLSTGKEIVSSCRIIDKYFLERYNKPHRNFIEDKKSALVMSLHYRKILEEIETGKDYEFEIVRLEGKLNLNKLKAFTQHPNNYVRIASLLAIMSIILGFAGVLLNIVGIILSIITIGCG